MLTQQSVVKIDEFEDYLRSGADRERLELIHGTIVEKPMPTQQHGIIAGNFIFYIKLYLRDHPGGHVSAETAHRSANDDYNRRIPDASYVASEHITVEGPVPTMPDLAIEIATPGQSVLELREKAHYYLTRETRLVWIALPDVQQIEVHTPGNIQTLKTGDTLTGGDVLPGFRVSVDDLF